MTVLKSAFICLSVGLSFGLSACTSKVLKADNAEQILKNDEFDKKFEVKAIPTEASPNESGTYVRLPGPEPVAAISAPLIAPPIAPPIAPVGPPLAPGKKAKGGKNSGKVGAPGAVTAPVSGAAAPSPAAPSGRQPPFEDAEGFQGRRPVKDPYRVGEKVTLDVSYFGVSAGDMTLEVRPHVEVSGRKSYHFLGRAVSTSVFAMFYAVDDWFETFVDFEDMIPYSYALHVKETKQLRETRSLFDWKTMRASFWDKKIDAEKKVEEKKQEWALEPYAQNIFSAPYYLRNFQLKPGKKFAFRVGHENENLYVTAEVLRRERISTPAGDFNCVVVKPKIELNGVFKPVGDIFIWLTDDDRKFLVRIESKIKIGTIVGVAKSIERGAP